MEIDTKFSVWKAKAGSITIRIIFLIINDKYLLSPFQESLEKRTYVAK